MKLLLIESAGKIRKLKSILGNEWNIKATMGVDTLDKFWSVAQIWSARVPC